MCLKVIALEERLRILIFDLSFSYYFEYFFSSRSDSLWRKWDYWFLLDLASTEL
jgi:hypothetical protein